MLRASTTILGTSISRPRDWATSERASSSLASAAFSGRDATARRACLSPSSRVQRRPALPKSCPLGAEKMHSRALERASE